MHEATTNLTIQAAIERGHHERAMALAAGIAWIRARFAARPKKVVTA